MTETELQAEVKRLTQEKANAQMQLGQLKMQSMSVGATFAGMVRELLLALGDPEDVEQVQRAKRHAKELLKQWDAMQEANVPRPPEANGAS